MVEKTFVCLSQNVERNTKRERETEEEVTRKISNLEDETFIHDNNQLCKHNNKKRKICLSRKWKQESQEDEKKTI